MNDRNYAYKRSFVTIRACLANDMLLSASAVSRYYKAKPVVYWQIGIT